MERFLKTLLRLLSPGLGWVLLLTPISAAAVIIVLVTGQQETAAGIISYLLSAYILAALVLGIPKYQSDIRTFISGNNMIAKIRTLINGNKYASLYLTDMPMRAKVSLYMGLSINLLYACFKTATGIFYASYWFGAEAVFYLALGMTRFLMLRNMGKQKTGGGLKQEYKTYRFCGYMLFVLNAALTGIVYQMIHQGRGNEYPGLMIYIVATFTFTFLAVSIADVIKYRKLNSPVLSAVKVITFVQALVAIYSLQIAMFSSFGEDETLERIMNSVFGGLLCVAIFGMAVFMVVRGFENLKKLRS